MDDRGVRLDVEAILDQLTDAVVVASSDESVVQYANEGITRLLGWDPGDLVGRPLNVLMPERLRLRHDRGFERYRTTGEPRIFGEPVELVALCKDGTEVDIDLTLSEVRVPEGRPGRPASGVLVVATLRDVGRRAELQRRANVARYLRATLEATTVLQEVDHPDEAMTTLLFALCEQLDWDVAVVWKRDDTGRLSAVDVWHAPDTSPRAIEAMTRSLHLASGEGMPGKVLATRGPRVVPDVTSSPGYLRADAAREAGLVTGVGFPLLAGNEILGVIEFFSRRARFVDDELIATLGAIGRQLGSYLARIQSETDVRALAATLQEALLPASLPAVDGLALSALYRPGAQGVSVGGDIYDVFRRGPDEWCLLIADVCGKGPEAASVTALARHTVRATALENGSPSQVMASLNRALHQGQERPFLTAVYAVLRRTDDRWTAELACAGHPMPVLVRPGGCVLAGRPGLLIGVVEESHVEPVTIDLEPGTTLVLYTDGVTEARGADGALFGEERMLLALAGTGGSAQAAVDALDGAVGAFAAGQGSDDDLAILAVAVPRSD
jgi:PAS domain S-box-containing protein